MRLPGRIISFAAMGVLATALCPNLSARADDLDPLAISYVPGNAIGWDIDVAITKNFFRDEGFDPKPVTFQNTVQSVQLLITGGVQLATGQIDPFLSAFKAGASEIGVIAAPADRPDWFLNASPDIKSPLDLKGKFVATASLQVGESWLTRNWLATQGLGPRDWSLIVVGTTALKMAALQRGSVAAAIMFQPLAIEAEQSGFPPLYRYLEGKPFPPVIYVVARKWAAEKERGKRLSRAFALAHKWLKDPANRDEAIAILKSFTKRNDKVMAEAYDLFIARDKLINDDAAVDTAGVANEVEIMTQNGGLPPGMKMGPETYMLPRELGGLWR